MSDSEKFQSSNTRRNIIKALGVAGVTGLAGCSGQSSKQANGAGDGTTGQGNVFNVAFNTYALGVPKNAQFNPYNPTNYPYASYFIFTPLTIFDPGRTKFIPVLASDWTVKDDTVEITINDGYTWHNGDPVTARDVATKFKLNRYMDYSISDFISNIEVSDTHTVTLTLIKKVNPQILWQTILQLAIDTKYEVYKKYLTAFENAKSEKARKEAQSKLSTFSLDKAIGNGPFTVDSRDTNEFLLKRYDAYPYATDINFSTVKMIYSGQSQKKWQALLSNQFDGVDILGIPPEVEKQLPENITEFSVPPIPSIVMQFQYDHELFGRRKVRQAIAYIIDGLSAGKAGFFDEAKRYQPKTMIYPTNMEKWLGKTSDQYINYKQNLSKASSLLKEEGFTKQNGTWYTPSGKPFTFQIPIPSYSDTVLTFQTIVGQLNKFGIKASVSATPATQYFAQVLPSADWGVSMGWAGGAGPHPYFSFFYPFSGEAAEYISYPSKVSIPPIGKPTGKERTVDPQKMVAELGRTTDKQREKELVQELAWIANYDLPRFSIFARTRYFYVDTKEWDVPKGDAPVMQSGNAPTILPTIGKLQYQGE